MHMYLQSTNKTSQYHITVDKYNKNTQKNTKVKKCYSD
jgi:hypothetical protein